MSGGRDTAYCVMYRYRRPRRPWERWGARVERLYGSECWHVFGATSRGTRRKAARQARRRGLAVRSWRTHRD